MAGVFGAAALPGRTVTGRYFGTGDGARTAWNLRGADSDVAYVAPSIYLTDWQGGGDAPTLLYTTARTNLILQSQTLDNATWTKTFVSLTANDTTAPDGTVTAEKFLETVDNQTHRAYQSFTASGGTYTASVYVKGGLGRDWIAVRCDEDSTIRYCKFDITNGVVGTSGNATGVITPVGNGWYRCSVTTTPAAGVAYAVLDVSNANGAIAAYVGDTAKGAYWWGAQIETGAVATRYIPTTTPAASATDFSLHATNGQVTFASAPVGGAWLSYKRPWAPSSNVYSRIGEGDGTSTVYSLPFGARDPFVLVNGVLQGNGTATNLCLQSQTFDNAAWSASTKTTPNNVTAPDGSLTGDTILSNGSITNYQDVVATSTINTMSVYIRKVSSPTQANRFDFYNVTIASDLLSVTVNLDTLAITYQAGSTGCVASSVGNGWVRVSLTVSSGVTVGNTIRFYAGFVGAPTSGQSAAFWGAQIETGALATPYIPTTTVAKTGDLTVAANGTVTFTAAPANATALTWTGSMGPQP